jgi:hypothetical protein
MTNKELQEELAKYPDDIQVCFADYINDETEYVSTIAVGINNVVLLDDKDRLGTPLKEASSYLIIASSSAFIEDID